jgi:uncharacterized protein YcgI (DUF1989 family)
VIEVLRTQYILGNAADQNYVSAAQGVASSYVDLRAERDTIAVISNCPQMHNPCNGYNPTPIRCVVRDGG